MSESLDALRKVVKEALEARSVPAPGSGLGVKMQGLYDALTPLAQLIREVNAEPAGKDAAAQLVIGFNEIVKNADDLAVSGLICDMLWKISDLRKEAQG